jgi:hypothetical protein
MNKYQVVKRAKKIQLQWAPMLQTFVLSNFNQKQTVKHDHKFTITENNNIKISKYKIKNHPKLLFFILTTGYV